MVQTAETLEEAMRSERRLGVKRCFEIGLQALGCALLLMAFPASAAPPAAPGTADLAAARAALLEADRAFSRLSEEQGMRAAFLAYLAEDAVIFRPGPVVGRAYIAARPQPAISLSWYPVLAEVAASGDLGYTTGPYELHELHELHAPRQSGAPADGSVVEHGYYVTVWRRQADGTWQVIADQGVTTPPPAGADAQAGRFGSSGTHPAPGHGTAPERGDSAAGGSDAGRAGPAVALGGEASTHQELLAADRAFASDAITHGARAAYMPRLAAAARLYRKEEAPAVGREAAGRALAADRQQASSWQPVAAVASRAGDLGYSYGNMAVMARFPPRRIQSSAIYFRVWQRQPGGAFQIALDLIAPLPAAGDSAAPGPAPPRAPGSSPP
jgi:ketosteroid isomerase-like protein